MIRKLKKLYNFYTGDLDYSEFKRLIKKDLPALSHFFLQQTRNEERRRKGILGFIKFLKKIFTAFLLRLSSIRRLIYSIAILFFVWAAINNNWSLAFFSVLLLSVLLALELVDKIIARDELAVAREIQSSLIPKLAPENNFFTISCFSEPAMEIGGDFYDFIISPSNGKEMFFVIGDVSGKGMSAAIHMLRLYSLIQFLMKENPQPKNILFNLNDEVLKSFKRNEFVTSAIMKIESSGVLNFARAGHQPIIYFHSESNTCELISPKGIGLGLANSEIFKKSLQEITIYPKLNDILLFFTDGITESMNNRNEFYGEERLQKLIAENAGKTGKEISDEIYKDLLRFSNNAGTLDDMSFVLFKCTKPNQTDKLI